MNAKQRAKIEKALTSPDGIALVRTALGHMLEFWNAKRDIEDLLLDKINGVVEDNFRIDELFDNMGAAGCDADDDFESIASFIGDHVESL